MLTGSTPLRFGRSYVVFDDQKGEGTIRDGYMYVVTCISGHIAKGGRKPLTIAATVTCLDSASMGIEQSAKEKRGAWVRICGFP